MTTPDGLQPPLALAAAYAAEQQPLDASQPSSLDEQFASVLSGLMDDEITPETAIQEFRRASASATQQHREGASAMLHRAAHRLHMFELAAEQESQAASWLLLQMLYCSGDTPAGVYMGADDVGGRASLRQMMADTVNSDSTLRRFAQVVMWLEELAAHKLSEAPVSRFAPHEAVWRSTQLAFGTHSASGSSQAELDPDAPNRQAGRPLLSAMDQQAEERLGAQLWQLIRAGKLKQARQLCCQAGQAWRSLSLSVGGEWGPLPVGPAAQKAAQGLDSQSAADELAWEVEGGAAAAMLAWKYACLAAADTAANNGGNKWEAAVYAALCGHVKRMLPVCSSWEDEAWAYCRAWLSLQTDALLLSPPPDGDEQPGAHEPWGAHQGMMLGPNASSAADDAVGVPLDVLEACVDLAAAGSNSSRPPSKERLREGLSVMAGQWPMQRLAIENDVAVLPTDFKELAALLFGSSRQAVANAARQQQHTLQLQLMAEDWGALVMQLTAASRRAKSQLDRQQRRRQRQKQQQSSVAGGFSAAGTATGSRYGGGIYTDDVDMDADGDDTSSQAGGGYGFDDAAAAAADAAGGDVVGGGSSGGMSQHAAVDVLRFSAHLGLALRALRLLPDPAAFATEAERDIAQREGADRLAAEQQKAEMEEYYARLQHELNGVVQAYASHLADSQEGLPLVPLYMCHLRLVGRKALLFALLTNAMAFWPDDEQRHQALYAQLASATTAWYNRQLAQQAALQGGDQVAAAPGNGLYGDLRREELRLLLQYMMARVTQDSSLSAFERCNYLRWLYHSYSTAADAAAVAQADAASTGSEQVLQLMWQSTWGDALSYTLVVAAAMALNPGFGGQGLVQLFSVVVPQDFAPAAATAAAAAAADPESGPLAQVQAQLQVQRQLQALTFWQAYARLQAWYDAWMADYVATGAAVGVLGPEGLQELIESAESLVRDMLALAQEDLLLLPAGTQVVQLLQEAAAAAGAEDPAGVVAAMGVTEGKLLAAPSFDAPGGLLLASSEDELEQQAVRFSELSMALTLARGQQQEEEGGSGAEAAAAARDPSLSYLQLTPPRAQQLQQQVAAFLQHAVASLNDVEFSTRVADADEPMAGCVVVEMRSYAAPPSSMAADPSEAALEASRQQAREVRAWHDLISAAVQLLSSAAGPSTSGGASPVPAPSLPRVALVHMSSSLSTQLAICRCRTTSKLLRRSAKVLHALVALGHSSPLLDTLLSAAADAAGPEGPQLLDQLTPPDAAKLLARLQAILVDFAGDPVNMQGTVIQGAAGAD